MKSTISTARRVDPLLTFLSLPGEIRQEILLQSFSPDDQACFVNKITQGDSATLQHPVQFWLVQEQGWIANSYKNPFNRLPMERVQKRLQDEIISRAKALEDVHAIIAEDMVYVVKCWTSRLESLVSEWRGRFAAQHRQVKGAGPGENNWWWIPNKESERWYRTLMDSASSSS